MYGQNVLSAIIIHGTHVLGDFFGDITFEQANDDVNTDISAQGSLLMTANANAKLRTFVFQTPIGSPTDLYFQNIRNLQSDNIIAFAPFSNVPLLIQKNYVNNGIPERQETKCKFATIKKCENANNNIASTTGAPEMLFHKYTIEIGLQKMSDYSRIIPLA